MSLDFDTYAIVILLAPFVVALLAPSIANASGRAAGYILAIVPAGLFAALVQLVPDIAAGRPIGYAVDWVPALDLRLSFRIDGLALVFGLMVSGIGAFILIYAADYLNEHKRRGYFLGVMLAFIGAMLGLVLADSLVALFAFWELTAVTSFLLIGFDREREAARRGAFQALVITGLGGLSLIAGGIMLRLFTGSWDISAMARFGGALHFAPIYPWIVGFIVVAAFTKSAQIPFHFWLPNAMEAPTPVSAYLHSAAMVQAGIYLLARMGPLLSGTPLWQGLLCTFGGATLLWGALVALRQTDLKQVLAQTTIAALGLMVVILGIGGEAGALALAAFFVAHALYKASLFLVIGIIETSTGTRDLTALGGLRDHLTITFIAAALAALSMFGVPPLMGWFAKEELYAALGYGDVWAVAILIVIVLGNALLGASALTLLIRPFMGSLKAAEPEPREGSFALWIGPALFGLLGLAVIFAVDVYGDTILSPMASSVLGRSVESHLSIAIDPLSLPILLSLVTWAIAAALYRQLDRVRTLLAAAQRRVSWSFDRGFDQVVFGVVRLAGWWTRLFHHGRLELYLIVVFASFALVILVPMAELNGWPGLPPFNRLTFYEWGAVALAAAGALVIVLARSRLFAIVALGIQGFALALIFIFFGAPDLGFTQLMIEILSVVILALVMTRLHLSANDPRPLEDWMRDGALAIICGVALTALLLRILEGPLDTRLSDFFEAQSYAAAHGRNIVNVILVDFRGLDTLGEISVVMTAGIAILALLRRQHKREAPPPEAPRRTRRKAAA